MSAARGPTQLKLQYACTQSWLLHSIHSRGARFAGAEQMALSNCFNKCSKEAELPVQQHSFPWRPLRRRRASCTANRSTELPVQQHPFSVVPAPGWHETNWRPSHRTATQMLSALESTATNSSYGRSMRPCPSHRTFSGSVACLTNDHLHRLRHPEPPFLGWIQGSFVFRRFLTC